MAEQARSVDPNANNQAERLSDGQKWLAAAACVAAALMMRYAGLLALWPRDPDLPVSLVTCSAAWLGAIEMMAIGAVTSALVVAAVGRRLPGIGVLAVGMGLLFLGWSHAEWRLVVAYVQSASAGQWVTMNTKLLGETLGWAGVILAGLAAERVAREWIAVEATAAGTSRASVVYSRTSVWFRALTQSREQWLMLVAAGLGGIVLVEVLYANNVSANLGQGYFIAGVAMLGGVVLTDNANFEIIRRERMDASLVALIYVPDRMIRKTGLPLSRIRANADLIELAYILAMHGDYRTAMKLNGMVYSSVLGVDPSVMHEALEKGAVAAGLSGTGPATVMLVERERAE